MERKMVQLSIRVPADVKRLLSQITAPTEILRPFATSVATVMAVKAEKTDPAKVLDVVGKLCKTLADLGIPERELIPLRGWSYHKGSWDVPGPHGWSFGTIHEEQQTPGETAEGRYVALTADGPKYVRVTYDWSPNYNEDSYTMEDLTSEDLGPDVLGALLEALQKLPEGLRRVAEELAEEEAKRRRIIALCEAFINAIKAQK